MKKLIFNRFAVANLIAVVIAIAGGAFGAFTLEKSILRYRQEVRVLQTAAVEILRAESYFKIQVQDWKDVLLRGKDPREREKYWNLFEVREAAVVKTVSAVESALPASFNRQHIRDFQAAHRQLSEEYRKGLEAFKNSGGDPYVGDAAVIGIDRMPTKLLDGIAVEISNAASEIQAETDAKAHTAVIVAAVAMFLAFSGSLMTYSSMTRESNRMEEERRIAAVAFESRLGIVVTDANQSIVRVNRSFTELTGYEAADVIGKTPALLRSGRHDADFFAAMSRAILQEGYWQGEIWNRRRNGEIYPEWLTITVVRNPKGKITHYVGSSWDITQRVEDETKIRNLAFFDPLTGLANRRLFTDRLAHAFAASFRSRSYGALLFIDLDRFKELNDTLGHAQGDRLLELVADRLTVNVREVDTVSRFGGDEFVVLLEELDCDRIAAADKAMALAEKLRTALNVPYKLQGTDAKDWHCTPSIGVAPFLGHDKDVEAVLAQADKALYAAKEGGRNTVRLAGT